MVSRQPFPPNPRPKTSIVFLAITISASLIILSAILYFLYYLWYSLVHRSRTSPFDATSPLNKLQKFSYRELKNATNNFSPSNSIGKGGSGTVFRGILKDGKLVAVKLLDSNSFQCEQEFQNELKILGGLKSCPLVVSLLGFCVEKGRRLVVYEYMPNRSLQESLLFDSNNGGCSSLSLSWDRRFSVILDVARALAFLHLECDPPVIHGDVKPSNVLLDSEFRAKLSDFGLSRLKLEGEYGVDLFSQELWKSQEIGGNSNAGGGGGGGGGENETPAIGTPVESHENDEVDFALALQASSSSKNSCRVYHNVMGLSISSLNFNSENTGGTLKGKELLANENSGVDWNKFVPYDDELSSIDHSKELNLNNAPVVGDDSNSNNSGAKQWGKDWWWRQDGSGELCSKDYVMEWIGSQICPSADPDWDEEKGAAPEKTAVDSSAQLDKCEEVNENPGQEPGFECLNGGTEKEHSKRWNVCAKKHRKMQEWWKEEHLDELSKKRKNKGYRLKVWNKERFKVPHFGLGKCFEFRSKRRKFSHENHETDDQNMEFSFRKGWRKKNHSMGSDMWSGDLFSRDLSSTTSMRGTLCYVAPEYGGYGYLMEKADIYSFGVLILVIVSGRRPLHVLSSPMKLEKANLISWSRSLAHTGNILELVDERLKDEYNKEQASLCINLALACLQKMPELRPDIGDVVKILKGEMELPSLPFEFSPSPPSKLFSRSRRKQKSSGD
ncbi:putative receptor-like protein kinase [Sesamum alatum]|uniref:non-specific serine/threonine protein kinase n=1 Tax=Sesamum alatum TaxID=300844 RepID=A0AAE1XL95_9LAMI|nr:putative receptor-like protein kinase [Sesamum alatum]